jgi:uncharacterized protein (DUF1810 family)
MGRKHLGCSTMATESKLADFVAAQDVVYDQVLSELKAGRKRTHWIWFIFPQMIGLGFSAMSQRFGIASKSEAKEYLKHDVLGPRLRECTQLLLDLPSRNIDDILGYPDDLKFRSSMTLFAAVAPEETIFEEALKKFFAGKRDAATINCFRIVRLRTSNSRAFCFQIFDLPNQRCRIVPTSDSFTPNRRTRLEVT